MILTVKNRFIGAFCVCFAGFMFVPPVFAQNAKPGIWTLTVSVKEHETREPLDYAHVSVVSEDSLRKGDFTDEKGVAVFHLPSGAYTMEVSYVGKKNHREKVIVNKNMRHEVVLKSSSTLLSDVYVTGKESTGMTSSTGIGRTAISHIQPSSFTDLLSLIPGGLSKDPALSVPNMIALREVSRPMTRSKYNTSSLGTAFYIDGRPVNTEAHMQHIIWGWQEYIESREFLNSGVDMRTITTDDIDSVEIVRGIPSVKYGDLTSGLITITRKKGGNKLEGRMKTDLKSQLYYLAKGFEFPQKKIKLNAGLNYLDYNPTPYSFVTRYNRLTGSLRGEKVWENSRNMLALNGSFDYTGSFDKVLEDADSEVGIDRDQYRRLYSHYVLTSKMNYRNKQKGFVRSLELVASIDYEKEEDKRFYQFRTQGGGPNYEITATEEGEHTGGFLPRSYMAHYDVDGRPFYANVRGEGEFALNTSWCSNHIIAGGDWRYSKNYGKGHLFDPKKPPYYGIRPRPFRDIPGESILGFFVENRFSLPFYGNLIKLNAGLRTTNILGLDERYAMSGKTVFDPRFNLQWQLPKVDLGSQPLRFTLTGGLGWHSKTPTIKMLFPDKSYLDINEFTLKNPVDETDGVHFYRTYIIDRASYSLMPARNCKWEIRGDVQYGDYHLSVDCYEENMGSGFRTFNQYDIYDYVKYSVPKDYDYGKYGYHPPLKMLNKQPLQSFDVYSMWENGSRTYKRGWEYTLLTPRIRSLATRISVSGAWQYVKYSSSKPIWLLKQKSWGSLNNETVIGHYREDDSYVRWRSTSRIDFDTYLPSIGFIFSSSLQFMWHEMVEYPRFETEPYEFMLLDKVVRPWTAENKEKYPVATLLGRDDVFRVDWITPFYMNLNLKATKKLFGDMMESSLFVDRLIDYYPKREKGRPQGGHAAAYFGAEIRFKL